MYFSRDSLRFIYFEIIVCQRLKKMFKPVEQLMLRDLTLARLTFAEWISSLKADDINF